MDQFYSPIFQTLVKQAQKERVFTKSNGKFSIISFLNVTICTAEFSNEHCIAATAIADGVKILKS